MPRRPETDLAIDEAFGRVLRSLRLDRGISQEQLGNDSGSGRTFISELERGKRGATLKTLFRLAPYLNCNPADIVRQLEDALQPRVRRPRR